MAKQMLKIAIAEDGSVAVKVSGAPGASCLDATKFLEEAMGGGVATQEMTDEFYQTEVSAQIEQGT